MQSPLGGVKVSMLTHTYPHKLQRRIEVTIYAITRLTANYMCGLMSDLLICNFRKKYGHTWHWMSLLRPWPIFSNVFILQIHVYLSLNSTNYIMQIYMMNYYNSVRTTNILLIEYFLQCSIGFEFKGTKGLPLKCKHWGAADCLWLLHLLKHDQSNP